ncbi:MAG: DNA repair protein RadA [Thermodesulfobacteriota bacterium]
MAKEETAFVCQECGFATGKWLGRCPDCGAWQSLVEERRSPARSGSRQPPTTTRQPLPLSAAANRPEERLATGSSELDRVLGGGLVPGSLVLLAGEPGIGKSTLLLQLLAGIARQGRTVLYVSGEESGAQIALRADRLGISAPGLLVAAESSLEAVQEMAAGSRPAVLAVDSIQTMAASDLTSAPGSVGQVRESAARLQVLAKGQDLSIVLVGHVTKEGLIAGPKVLEHLVDTVLSFEGDRGHLYRILRAVKNRFGPTNEIGVFEMKTQGLVEVGNPSEIFLAERPVGVPGSVVLPSMEGSRPILVEVQALVSPSGLAMPRRTAIGVDPQRLGLLAAVLEKKAGLSLATCDVFVNIAGGIRVDEPALDLGVVAAVASSLLERVIPPRTAVCGEVGLAGEVRAVSQMETRIQEAKRLGFSRLLLPRGNRERLGTTAAAGMALIGVADLAEVLAALFASGPDPAA